MASEFSFARGVSLPAAAHWPPLAFTSYRLRHSAACTRANPRVVAAARAVSVAAARRMPGSVRYGGARVAALRAEEAEVAVPPSVPVRVAYELQLAGHRYLDVRTEGEFGGGHPAGAVNVPYMYSTGSGMAKNPHFLEQVSAIFGRDDEIIIGCQSGKRSLMAAAELCSSGFTAVTDIAGGFSTWRENGLPVNGRGLL
ncbi:thiosulfate sulfurtransferase 16, chloroplastic-like [Triticum dicoccoides]|uniref:thiosulfate sulfurtransferase 16, chloroplastic-like n=1 Tax=Triticum dicoccoides TaxID=85692 RepID=UPI000E7CB03B|nr:thiosulfate sulfurtransferase 16, chloroplastic-like [Triticum dicoccoides]